MAAGDGLAIEVVRSGKRSFRGDTTGPDLAVILSSYHTSAGSRRCDVLVLSLK